MGRLIRNKSIRVVWSWSGAVIAGSGMNMIISGPLGFILCATFAVALASVVFKLSDPDLPTKDMG